MGVEENHRSLPQPNSAVLPIPLLERLSYRRERSPFGGTEGVDARPNLFAALAPPAPVGVFLHFTQPRHQTHAADSRANFRGFAQVKEFPDRLAVDAIGGAQLRTAARSSTRG